LEGNLSVTTSTASNPVVAEVLAQISRIATLPQITSKILTVLEDPDTTAQDLQTLVSSDPVLSARVLKVVNSSFYGRRSQVASIRQSIVVLGMNALRNIALAASLAKLFKTTAPRGFDPSGVWSHSVAAGSAARLICEHTGDPAEEMFLAGLVHDLGTVIQLQTRRTEFAQLLEIMATGEFGSARKAEKQILGATHEEIGLAICEKWGFPEAIKAAVGFHHEPSAATGASRRTAQLIGLADSLANESGIGYCCSAHGFNLDGATAELGLTPSALATVRERLPALADDAMNMLS